MAWTREGGGERELEDSLTHEKAEVGLLRGRGGDKRGDLGGVYVERRHVVEGGKITHVYEMQLEKELRWQGLGGEIIRGRAEVEKGEGRKGMILQVAHENWEAREAYTKWGFEETGTQLREGRLEETGGHPREEGGCTMLEMRWMWDENAKERMRAKREG